MLVKTYGAAVFGVDAKLITVETDVDLPFGFTMVGLADKAVTESKDRIQTAIQNNNLIWPRRKITINLAPADLKKEGSAYDLTIAMGILAGSGQVEEAILPSYLIMGEMSLDGTLFPIKGALPIALMARDLGFRGFILPEQNAKEAAIVQGLEIIPVKMISDAVNFLNGVDDITPLVRDTNQLFAEAQTISFNDFSDVKGQENIKRAMEVAAAGGHNVILIGPPGSGKTMLAKRLPSILPPLSLDEALETTKIHSVAGCLNGNGSLIVQRPFRSPHHTISDVALVGGGQVPHPGEISLSHNGVLFLDELPEFKRTVLEVMRQPLEERKVTVSRAKFTVEYPANFMLIASMNPCPCGFHNHPKRDCICNPQQVHRYLGRISGPLLDRIDLHIEVTPVDFDELTSRPAGEKSSSIRERVVRARQRQLLRFQTQPGIYSNAMMPPQMVRQVCRIEAAGEALLKTAMQKLDLSARAYDRILKVARTIADLDDAETIKPEHVAEAIQYRSLDRESWAG